MVDSGIPFGPYTLLRRLARGGMAEVFLASQRSETGFERKVAIKRILPHLADSYDFVRMFLAETQLAARLTHPNIVHVYDSGRVGGDYYIAMEFVDGVTGTDLTRMTETKKMPAELLARVGAAAAAALHYAHELRDADGKPLRLVHRDVSPANLMVTRDGTVKVVDFGIAKAFAAADDKTNPGVVKGKYAYMSPEQTGGGGLDGRSDVFSLGICLLEIAGGRPLVERGDAISAMRIIRDGHLPRAQDFAPYLPEAMSRAIDHALCIDREDRSTAAELARALEAVIKSSPEVASSLELGAWVRAHTDAANVTAQPSTAPLTQATVADLGASNAAARAMQGGDRTPAVPEAARAARPSGPPPTPPAPPRAAAAPPPPPAPTLPDLGPPAARHVPNEDFDGGATVLDSPPTGFLDALPPADSPTRRDGTEPSPRWRRPSDAGGDGSGDGATSTFVRDANIEVEDQEPTRTMAQMFEPAAERPTVPATQAFTPPPSFNAAAAPPQVSGQVPGRPAYGTPSPSGYPGHPPASATPLPGYPVYPGHHPAASYPPPPGYAAASTAPGLAKSEIPRWLVPTAIALVIAAMIATIIALRTPSVVRPTGSKHGQPTEPQPPPSNVVVTPLTAARASLALTSTPPGATVRFGDAVFRTPTQLSLPAGAYELRLSLDGFVDETVRGTLAADESRALTVELRRAK